MSDYELEKIIGEHISCNDCGGYGDDHDRNDGFCNYEAFYELVDDTIAKLKQKPFEEKLKEAFGWKCAENHHLTEENIICKRCTNEKARIAQQKLKAKKLAQKAKD